MKYKKKYGCKYKFHWNIKRKEEVNGIGVRWDTTKKYEKYSMKYYQYSSKYKHKFQWNIKRKVEVNGIGSGVRWDTVGKYKKYSMKY